jgi:glycosyltransferase involved in cell wall biosynthesis
MSFERDASPSPFPDLLVSVVVIGRNEGERLRGCLQSVAAMKRDGFALEVLYVDSGSTDGSVSLAQAHGVRTISLAPERPSAAMGRNAGWRAARGAVVLFLDGDTVLHPEFVSGSLPEFAAPTVAVIWGHRRELYPERSLYNRVLDLDWVYPPGWSPFCGGDALFRREVLERTGGFDETLIAGEEPELCRRIRAMGFQILHVDRPMTGHDLAITHWSQYWKRAVRAGHAFAEVSERFRASSPPFWREESRGNQKRALLLAGSLLIGILASLRFTSAMPLGLVVLLLGVLILRSAWRARWKTADRWTLLLYGVHSHLQQFPIYVGQLQYRWNRRKGRRAMLLEYKQP